VWILSPDYTSNSGNSISGYDSSQMKTSQEEEQLLQDKKEENQEETKCLPLSDKAELERKPLKNEEKKTKLIRQLISVMMGGM